MTADVAVMDAVESMAAAHRTAVVCTSDVGRATAAWRQADVVLVAPDCAADLVATGPRHRDGVYVVGFDSAALGVWSVPLGAEVIPLPRGATWLSAVLNRDARDRSPVVAVLGGSGGVGASTFAAGLALANARRGDPTALVDADPLGGGLDLLMGLESTAGHRWPRLAEASGEVGDMRGLLPQAEGVAVLSMARSEDPAPSAESASSVTGSLARHHGLVVVDGGRRPSAMLGALLGLADPILILCGGSVRSVAACSDLLRAVDVEVAGVVVRRQAGLRIPPEVVADALDLELWGVAPNDGRLAGAAESGEPPWRAGSSWSRALTGVLDRILAGDHVR
ncbi:MAG: septum site-determining protein Ssd [Propioniciclava sp.]